MSLSSPSHSTAKMLGHQGDLVIAFRFSFDFSWKSREDALGGMVDPKAVHYTIESDWLAQIGEIANLRRVKAVHVPRQQMDELLRKLESCPKLEQLEIETLAVHHRQKRTYKFAKLRLLSIDEVKLLDDRDKPTVHSYTSILIDAAQLATLIFGSDALSFINFKHPNSVRSLTIDRDSKRKMLLFTELTTLRLNQAQLTNFLDVSKLLQYRKLEQLFCNTRRLEHTSYKPNETEVKYLECMYQQLEIRSLYPQLQVYFNHVPLTSNKQFNDYHFERNLANAHYHNFVPGETAVVPCESLTKLYYLDLLDDTFELGRSIDKEISKLFELYCNIRVCVLDNSNGHGPVDEDSFAILLSRCDMLAELTICNSGFPAAWYKNLHKVSALRNLIKFSLSESIGFAGHVKFEFLSHFKHLLRFSTNLATRQEMIDLVQQMRVLATMAFQFWDPKNAKRDDIVVQKLNNDELSLYHRKADPDGQTDTFESGVMTFADAIEQLRSIENLFCGNWMEDLWP